MGRKAHLSLEETNMSKLNVLNFKPSLAPIVKNSASLLARQAAENQNALAEFASIIKTSTSVDVSHLCQSEQASSVYGVLQAVAEHLSCKGLVVYYHEDSFEVYRKPTLPQLIELYKEMKSGSDSAVQEFMEVSCILFPDFLRMTLAATSLLYFADEHLYASVYDPDNEEEMAASIESGVPDLISNTQKLLDSVEWSTALHSAAAKEFPL